MNFHQPKFLRFSFIWDTTQRRLVGSYPRFETTYPSHLQGTCSGGCLRSRTIKVPRSNQVFTKVKLCIYLYGGPVFKKVWGVFCSLRIKPSWAIDSSVPSTNQHENLCPWSVVCSGKMSHTRVKLRSVFPYDLNRLILHVVRIKKITKHRRNAKFKLFECPVNVS